MITQIYDGDYPLTSKFGWRIHPITKKRQKHWGTDWGLPCGTKLRALKAGRVTYVGSDGRGGLMLTITHNDGTQFRYLHIGESVVRKGDRVKKGQHVANSGNSGYTTGCSLHGEYVREAGNLNTRVDPAPVVDLVPDVKDNKYRLRTNRTDLGPYNTRSEAFQMWKDHQEFYVFEGRSDITKQFIQTMEQIESLTKENETLSAELVELKQRYDALEAEYNKLKESTPQVDVNQVTFYKSLYEYVKSFFSRGA